MAVNVLRKFEMYKALKTTRKNIHSQQGRRQFKNKNNTRNEKMNRSYRREDNGIRKKNTHKIIRQFKIPHTSYQPVNHSTENRHANRNKLK